MAKFLLKIKARELRSQGTSIRTITRELQVAKSTVSLWCRDIELTPEQTEKLLRDKYGGGTLGRFKGAMVQKQRRLDQIETLRQEGIIELARLTPRELLLAGLGIYWGEGFKTNNRAGFANSDPEVVRIIIKWFQTIFNIPLSEMRFRVGINEIYRSDMERVHIFWYTITGASPDQFSNPSFIRTQNKKVYANKEAHYGTLGMRVRNGCTTHRKILGLIEGLKQSTII